MYRDQRDDKTRLRAKLALQVTASALVLNRGRVSYSGPSDALLADPQRLTSLVLAQ